MATLLLTKVSKIYNGTLLAYSINDAVKTRFALAEE